MDIQQLLTPKMETVPEIRILINIGCLMDIPTGTYMTGKHGESILNGGLGSMVSVVGIGNSFKSTILHYMMLSAADKILATGATSMLTYDTELNIHLSRLEAFTKGFERLKDIEVMGTIWSVTDKSIYSGNEWYEKLKEFLRNKTKARASLLRNTPFIEKSGNQVKMMIPTFTEVDSFSEFDTDAANKMQDENELGDSGANTLHLRLNLAKTSFLNEVNKFLNLGANYLLTTAQVGKETVIATGPGPQPNNKKLQHLKNGDKIKGVPDKYYFLNSSLYQVINASPLVNQGTKGPEYPSNPDDNRAYDTDLNVAVLKQLRSKSGISGNTVEIIISQRDGVLPSLTEFHFIKSMERFGLEGSLQNYVLDIYPEVKLSRTTIRSKIDNDPKLRRALNITAELCQMHTYMRAHYHYLCTPKVLYDDLMKLGYDWDILLNTRGWWTLENETYKVHFLSTLDLLKMRKGEYKPYWLKRLENG